jgi:uncharacterized protein YgbK (DUF1537 family)
VDISVTGEQANVECILIADDLTGACDTGVQFVRRGLSCRVELKLSEPRAPAMTDVLAFNTNSRSDSIVECRRKIEEVAGRSSHLKANIIFKKVDSMLRGNVGEEIATALSTFQCQAAIIAPAFPAMCRLVRAGILHWVDCSGSGEIDIRCLLSQQGVSPEKLVLMRLAGRNLVNVASDLNLHIVNGKKLFIVDCESQGDLHFAVAAGIKLSHRLLWVGSAGLGIAVADCMAKSQTHKSVSAVTDAPLMFVIGSTHLATLRQKRTLLAATDAVEVTPGPETIGAARNALRDKRHLVVSIEHGRLSESSLRQFFDGLEGIPVAAIFLTGGDTGMLVCNAIGAHSINLRDEIAPGFPWGILCGGMFHGLPVASKSGSFGDEDVLVRCVEFFAPEGKALR